MSGSPGEKRSGTMSHPILGLEDSSFGFTEVNTGREEEQTWEINNTIRTHMRQYLNKLIFIIARLKTSMIDFLQRYSPGNLLLWSPE